MRFTHKILILLFISFGLLSCIDEIPPQTISEYSIQIIMPEGFKTEIKYQGQTVTLSNNRTNYTAKTNENGKVTFSNIIPGIYSASTTWEIDGDKYIEMADTVVENKSIVLAGFLNDTIFVANDTVLTLSKSTKQSLIISKIYASGTKDINNKNYVADRYVEFFNNSDEVLQIDSTYYFGLVEAESVIAFPASANAGFVFARQIFRFVTGNTTIDIKPGGSIVVANSAIDHTQFSGNTANLRIADFEAKNTTYSNNSAVPALELMYSAFPALIYMNLINGGDNGVFLFKTDENVRRLPIFYIPGKEQGNRYMQIPIQYLVDGVESLKNYVTGGPRPNSKRLQTFVDAGFMFITATSGYTHESIERRVDVSKSTPERYYLIDSNNSTNDFRVVTDPTPRKYDKSLLMTN